jgi:hypothetical protein
MTIDRFSPSPWLSVLLVAAAAACSSGNPPPEGASRPMGRDPRSGALIDTMRRNTVIENGCAPA